MEIRPNYYKDEAGHDLFWKMEHGMYDLAWSIGFCHSMLKNTSAVRAVKRPLVLRMNARPKRTVMKKND